jgi:hypothetical protein
MTSKGDLKGGLSRRSILKAGAAIAGTAVGSPSRPSHDLGAGNQGHRTARCRRVLFFREGDRRSSGQGSRLQGYDAEANKPDPNNANAQAKSERLGTRGAAAGFPQLQLTSAA